MVAEEVIVTLSGGAPWGFRLQGGVEHQKPLQVAKVREHVAQQVRKRSKACRAGLREADELVCINDQPCGALSHAQAMHLIDSSSGILHIRVKRSPAGFQSVVLLTRAPSPRIDREYRASLLLSCMSPPRTAPARGVHGGLTSPPPGSEAYYGETDSDADVMAGGQGRQRRQKRRSPSNPAAPARLPPPPGGRSSPEGGETSEMSGYDSAPDAHHAYLRDGDAGEAGKGGDGGGEGGGGALPGVARREVIYQPPSLGTWSSQTSTETSSDLISSTDDQGPRDRAPEEDSGFLEMAAVPLVSPERAKGALMLGSRSQLVPMVGPVGTPVDEELTKTYAEKAKQAKLNRGDTQQDKQVKEAKTKCRTIASLLTDAPNPHSKGVLMFKKRRQRSKKYTLTSFGSVDEDLRRDSQEEEEEEEDGVLLGSESEFDEDGFSAAPDPTWDSDYLDALEKRAAAGGGGGRGDGAEEEAAPSPGLSDTTGKGAQLFEQQRKRAAEHAKKVQAAQPQTPPRSQTADNPQVTQTQPQVQPSVIQPQQTMPAPLQREEMYPVMHQGPEQASGAAVARTASNGDLTYSPVSKASMVMSHPAATPKPAAASVTVLTNPAPPAETPLPEVPSSNVLNRTARPFAPGFITSRAATAPVVFRPTVTKKTQRPASAAIVSPPFSTSSQFVAPATSQPLAFSPPPQPFGLTRAGAPMAPPAHSTPVESVPPVATVPQAPTSAPAVHMPPMCTVSVHPAPTVSMAAPGPHTPMPPVRVSQMPQPPVSAYSRPLAPAAPVPLPAPVVTATHVAPVSVVSQMDTAAPTPVPVRGSSGRTGILLEARRRSGKPRPMFNVPDVKKNSPNPELLSMVQNLDERPARYRYGPPPPEAYDEAEEDDGAGAGRGRMPPPVAPKPRVIHEAPQIPPAEGKGAQLFARRQGRMSMYVVDTPPETPYQREVLSNPSAQPCSDVSHPSQWKYSPNIRAPPPIGYNPLLAPSVPVGPQRDAGRGKGGAAAVAQKEGIRVLDFMRRQPYQLNYAMFSYGGSAANLSPYQAERRQQQQGGYSQMVGSSLTQPRQIPVKAARVYEIKRFSTPTPMSAPTLTPKVIAPRSATTLGERLTRHDAFSPPPSRMYQPLASISAAHVPSSSAPLTTLAPRTPAFALSPPTTGPPVLPQIAATPIPNTVPNVHPVPYAPVTYTPGLQAAKQFQSAPELSLLFNLPPVRPNPVQVPKPRFIATRGGIQPHVWRPGAL